MNTKLTTTVLFLFVALLLSGKPSIADINGDEVIISSSNETIKLDVTNKIVIIEGSSNTVYLIGTCRELIIKGSGNSMEMESLTSVKISGNSNKISYSSGTLVISDSGANNVLESTQVLQQTELAK